MLLSQNLLDSLVDANNSHRKLAGCLFRYDKRQQRLRLSRNKWERFGFLARYCLLVSVAGVLVCRTLGGAYGKYSNDDSKGESNRPGSALRVLMIVATITCGERYRIRGMYPTEYIQFVNAVIQLELKYAKGVGMAPSKIAVLARTACQMTHYLGKWMFPITMGIVSVLKPQLPTNVISAFGWEFAEHLDSTMMAILVFSTNTFVWAICTVQGYCLVAEISVGALGLTFSQHVMLRRFNGLLKGPSSGTIRHGNPLYEIIGFRSLQITVKLFNQCMQTLLFMFMLANGVAQMIGVAVQLGKSGNPTAQIPMSIRIFGGACIVQSTLCIIVIYGFAGNFHDESLKAIQKLQRISFGFSNFIERTTPLVFQMFCLNRIVDLLLLRK